MDEYLQLLPTLLYILAVFGLVFSIIAAVAKHLRGQSAVWKTWGAYLLIVTVSCIIGLSRVTSAEGGAVPRLIYYVAVALGTIGFPLWCAARTLIALSTRTPAMREQWQVLGAWMASVAAAPIGLLLMYGVDRIAAELQWSPFTS